MKKTTKILAVLMALCLCIGLTACGGKQGNGDAAINYSLGLTVDGKYEGINIKDYVTLGQYTGIEFPEDVLAVTAEELQEQLDYILSDYPETIQVTDRAVADKDTVNIDYIGKVDGVEFEGGSTGGSGTTVTIGVTSYIDTFLEDLIGHMPGETFDIEETFPEEYPNNPDLAGKTAVFTVTVNFIRESKIPELTDEFVAANLGEQYEISTVEELKVLIGSSLRHNAINEYMWETIENNCPISEVPSKLVEDQLNIAVKNVKWQAMNYNVDDATIYSYNYGVTNEEEFRTSFTESMTESVKYRLLYQAIAEDAGLMATEEDLNNYFAENMPDAELSEYVANYGYGYLYQAITSSNVAAFLESQNPHPEFTAADLPDMTPAAEVTE